MGRWWEDLLASWLLSSSRITYPTITQSLQSSSDIELVV